MAPIPIKSIPRGQRTEDTYRNSSKMCELTLKTVRETGKMGRAPIKISENLHTPKLKINTKDPW